MPTRTEIEMAKAILVLVSGCLHQTGTNAYTDIDLSIVEDLANAEPDDD